MKLTGKTAIITGGGTGIGKAIAHALAAEGAKVAIAGRRADKLRIAAEANNLIQLLHHEVDVTDRSSVARLFQWAAESLGPIDILVNGAGANIVDRTLADTTPEAWDQLMAINATGAFNCLSAVLPQMRERKDGLIVNISSVAGKRTLKLAGLAYCASKFAMTALGTFASLELGPLGIRVTNIYPGEVDTPILENRPTPITPEHRARILQPEDVAAAVVMIACLPSRANVSEFVIKPTTQDFA